MNQGSFWERTREDVEGSGSASQREVAVTCRAFSSGMNRTEDHRACVRMVSYGVGALRWREQVGTNLGEGDSE